MSHNHQVENQVETRSRWPRALRLSQVFADPLRMKILSQCEARPMSPRLFHEEVGGATLAKISQAFDLLVQYDWLERVETSDHGLDPSERLHRAIDTPVVHDEEWAKFPGSTRALIAARIFESFVARAKDAMKAGTLSARPDTHLTWRPLELDQEGWERMIARVDAIFESLEEEREQARSRMAASGEEPIPMTVGLMVFESPPGGRW